MHICPPRIIVTCYLNNSAVSTKSGLIFNQSTTPTYIDANTRLFALLRTASLVRLEGSSWYMSPWIINIILWYLRTSCSYICARGL
jgi:hypothetical protein